MATEYRLPAKENRPPRPRRSEHVDYPFLLLVLLLLVLGLIMLCFYRRFSESTMQDRMIKVVVSLAGFLWFALFHPSKALSCMKSGWEKVHRRAER